jgi:hypothetical protein
MTVSSRVVPDILGWTRTKQLRLVFIGVDDLDDVQRLVKVIGMLAPLTAV